MSGEELQSIYQRLERIEVKLDAIGAHVTQQTTICGPSRQRLDAVCTTIYGNGHEGLVTRVSRLETVRRLWANAAAASVGLLSGITLTVLAWLLGK